jgi:hypothetical protein
MKSFWGRKRTPLGWLWAWLLILSYSGAVRAQSDVPIISGGVGFFENKEGGANSIQPVVAPVVLIPLGDRWLIESRSNFTEVYNRQDGTTGAYQGQFFGTLEYLQVDYNVNSALTVTAGRFLTPFGIFNERLTPIWINRFQDGPYTGTIGTAGGYADGLMARGGWDSGNGYSINYTAYASTLSTVNKLESERSAGGRFGVFFPKTRLEIGTSYNQSLQGARGNSEGLDMSWDPYSAPLDVKGEWAHAPGGQGYWIEAAYRLSQYRGSNSASGRLEPLIRMEQFHRSQPIAGDFLPGVSERRPDFGVNYYLPHEVRLHASYGRQFNDQRDSNIWEFGVVYRFLFPLWPGRD